MELTDIKQGDRVTHIRPSFFRYKPFTVRAVTATGVRVFRGGLIDVPLSDIKKVIKKVDNVLITGTFEAYEMRRKGITEAALAERSGYSLSTISHMSLGNRVLPRTLADIRETISNWK